MSKTLNLNDKTIIISRTDSIGDVVLTLALCIWIKKQFPASRLIFLGNTYTRPVLECLSEIDVLLCWKDFENLPTVERIQKIRELNADVCVHVFPKKEIALLMKKAKVPVRIGTSHRAFHILNCTHRLNFSRKKSTFHEAQLNFELLKPFGLEELPTLNEISSWMSASFKAKDLQLPEQIRDLRQAIILHPKSQGSAVEFPMEKYIRLATVLLEKGETVVFSGTEKEGDLFRSHIPVHENCIDLTGKLTLDEFITFISRSKALVACSTGPYHLAGVLGIRAIGLFSSRKPIHPGRWKALGLNSQAIVYDPDCETCKKGKKCRCIEKIEVEQITKLL